ncbi:MAG: flagellar basal body rod protein FlgC [Myxococcota bacterium]|jgi:flagellar basal-body rod protein FlgC
MDLLDTLNISASGLSAQRTRLQTVASNMANARTTRTADGGPYKRRAPVFQASMIDRFGDMMDQELSQVQISEIDTAETEGMRVFDPDHPDADAEGFVTYPDINILHEMVDMMNASRSYEANAKVLDTTFEMAARALEIGR